jgi:hypothetical protein
LADSSGHKVSRSKLVLDVRYRLTVNLQFDEKQALMFDSWGDLGAVARSARWNFRRSGAKHLDFRAARKSLFCFEVCVFEFIPIKSLRILVLTVRK